MPNMDIQKIGFVGSAVCFMVIGVICLVAGLAYDVTTLKWMGIWLPLGAIQLALVLRHYRRQEQKRDGS